MRHGSAASSRKPEALDAGLFLLLFGILLTVGFAVLSPLLRNRRDREPEARAERLTDLEARKEAKYREIRDAESDFHAGKLSREDYRALDRGLRREAIAILEEMDRVSEGSQPPESPPVSS